MDEHPADKYLQQVETYLADLRTWNPPSVPTGPLDLQLENIRDARHLIKATNEGRTDDPKLLAEMSDEI